MYPKELAIVYCKGYQSTSSKEAEENRPIDKAARKPAKQVPSLETTAIAHNHSQEHLLLLQSKQDP